jgi:hypothetical protein
MRCLPLVISHAIQGIDELLVEWDLDRNGMPEIYWPPGLIADPDENGNTAIALIKNASDDELNQAREIFWAFMSLPSLLDLLGAAGPSGELKFTRELSVPISALKKSIIQIPAWRLVLLVNFLAFEKQAPDQSQLIKRDNNTMISMYWVLKSGIMDPK